MHIGPRKGRAQVPVTPMLRPLYPWSLSLVTQGRSEESSWATPLTHTPALPPPTCALALSRNLVVNVITSHDSLTLSHFLSIEVFCG